HLYQELHVNEKDEHFFALSFMLGAMDFLDIKSVLDVGSGTGRSLSYCKQKYSNIKVLGVEPVKELREIGYKNGLSEKELVNGNALNLDYADYEFDLVCCFGLLHHIKEPDLAIAEMLRVSRKAIFISDANNFGQGSLISRSCKQLLDYLKLWRIADWVKTGGKGYTLSDGDGLAYSYSVFSNFHQIEKQCKTTHLLNTKGGKINFYKTASHVALLGIK
ncbi:MAG: class I SAM-dependent methyltransferase, partial [Leptolyngbya sp. SIO3F4]|nr:class I SAM-dependent methyltransferase [Leptolyngbya sp. SIO3F4]